MKHTDLYLLPRKVPHFAVTYAVAYTAHLACVRCSKMELHVAQWLVHLFTAWNRLQREVGKYVHLFDSFYKA